MKMPCHTTLVAFLSTTVVVALMFLGIACYMGLFPDWGLEFGYYGQFNRTRHVIEEMSGVQITESWMYKDVTLENFGFVLALEAGQTVRVDFSEGSPQKVQRSKAKIREFVKRHIVARTTIESL